MLCGICEREFVKEHHNQKYCSDECKKQAIKNSKEKYKKSEKGIKSNKKWINSDRRKENEKRYRQKPTARAKAVKRSIKCLSNSPELQEKKRLRDIEYGRSKKGKEKNRVASAKYRKTPKGKATNKRQKYIKRAIGEISQEAILKIEEKNHCYYCGELCNDDKTIDHKHPVSRGGTNDIDNLVVACRSCNCSKNDKTEEEYRMWRNENDM